MKKYKITFKAENSEVAISIYDYVLSLSKVDLNSVFIELLGD